MITWNVSTAVKSPIFSDENLTIKMPSGNSKVETTEIKDKGNFYFEIKSLNQGVAPFVGIFNPNKISIATIGYSPYNNIENLVTTNYPFTHDLNFDNGSITGIAIDSVNKKIKFYKNGVFKLEKDFNFDIFNIIVGCGSSSGNGGNATLTANFGATEFDIITSNPEEWNRLKSEGYLPYDFDSVKTTWWGADIENVNISKTNIWHTDKNNINLSCFISHPDNEDIKYKILVNNTKAVELDNFISTPTDINIDIPIDLFTKEENLLELVVFDEGGEETSFKYNVIKENRDTFIFTRVFDFKEDYITDSNIKAIYQEGLALKDIGTGSFKLNIPTEGKAKIKNIEVVGAGNQNKEPIIPTLTSNSQDGYEVSASSINGSSFDAWKSFDDKNIETDDCWISNNGSPLPQWIQIKLPVGEIVSVYAITSRNYPGYVRPPKSWQLQGSLDGINWIILDERKDMPNWQANETRIYNITSDIGNYLYYRLVITDKHDSVNFVAIGELQLYKTDLDTTEEITIDNPMTYVKDLGAGKVYESRLLTEYNDITNISNTVYSEMMVSFDPNTSYNIALSNNNKTATNKSDSNVKISEPKIVGRWVLELIINNMGSGITVGVGDSTLRTKYPGCDTNSYGWNFHNGYWWNNGLSSSTVNPNFSSGDVCGICLDLNNKEISFYKNGSFLVKKGFDLDGYIYFEIGSGTASGAIVTLLTDRTELIYSSFYPDGYLPYNYKMSGLIESNNKYYTYQNNEFIEVEPTVENFKEKNIYLSDLTTPTDKVILTMEGGEELEDGRLYRKTIDVSKYGQVYSMDINGMGDL